MQKKQKKKFWPLAVWLLCFVAAMAGVPVLLSAVYPLGGDAQMRVSMGVLLVSVMCLMLLIHRGGYAYWVNGGPTYAQAASDPAATRAYTKAHLVLFAKGTGAGMAYLLLSGLVGAPAWLTILVTGGTLAATAFFSMRIRWNAS